ncbi:MAG: ribosome-associated translation inhibitor RaiA [Kiloniellales bacterium]|nr:ribosome-associated translation inhibitor RaiA [Kiloniellales bacterium]
MQLSVQGRQIDVSDAFRNHVEDALGTIFNKYFGDAIEASVTLSREAHLLKAVVTAHVGRNIQLTAQGEADAPYTAFDMAADRLSKRLRRHKRRLRDHHKADSGLESIPAQQYILAGIAAEHEEDAPAADGQPAVVAEMTTEVPTLTVGEAVMRMDLAELPAMMFRNKAHGGLNMIYRRPDGNIGWVDPRGNQSK